MNSKHKPLETTSATWTALADDLRRRGDDCRESGAFLLGSSDEHRRKFVAWVAYDDLDVDALSEGYVRLGTAAFTKLWAICGERNLEVVADVHTHPGNPRQSISDREHPMVSIPGHMAIIVPNFAQGVVLPGKVSVNIYQGGLTWQSFFGRDAEKLINLIEEPS